LRAAEAAVAGTPAPASECVETEVPVAEAQPTLVGSLKPVDSKTAAELHLPVRNLVFPSLGFHARRPLPFDGLAPGQSQQGEKAPKAPKLLFRLRQGPPRGRCTRSVDVLGRVRAEWWQACAGGDGGRGRDTTIPRRGTLTAEPTLEASASEKEGEGTGISLAWATAPRHFYVCLVPATDGAAEGAQGNGIGGKGKGSTRADSRTRARLAE